MKKIMNVSKLGSLEEMRKRFAEQMKGSANG